jgi:septal ring factor EnvC (AmiA/AmiB activator)
MDHLRTATYLGLSAILALVALGGWGAFAYSLSLVHQQDHALREVLAQQERTLRGALAQQERLTAELGQIRADLTRSRQALERAQVDLIVARAEAEQLKAQQSQLPAGASAPVANPAPVA